MARTNPGEWRGVNHEADRAKERRDALRLRHLCINGELHGPPVIGLRRCAWCVTVHRVGVKKALELAVESPVNAQPPPKVYKKRAPRIPYRGDQGHRLVLP